MWSSLGINLPTFNYITIYGRRLSQKEYNTRKVDEWM
jgi:hypothetical protein